MNVVVDELWMLLLFFGSQFFLVGFIMSNLYCSLVNEGFFIGYFLPPQVEILNIVVHLLRIWCATWVFLFVYWHSYIRFYLHVFIALYAFQVWIWLHLFISVFMFCASVALFRSVVPSNSSALFMFIIFLNHFCFQFYNISLFSWEYFNNGLRLPFISLPGSPTKILKLGPHNPLTSLRIDIYPKALLVIRHEKKENEK